MAQSDYAYRASSMVANDRWNSSHSPLYNDPYQRGRFDTGSNPYLPQSVSYTPNISSSGYNLPAGLTSAANVGHVGRTAEPAFSQPPAAYNPRLTQGSYTSPAPSQVSFKGMSSQVWDQPQGGYHGTMYQGVVQGNHSSNHLGNHAGRYSPADSLEDIMASPNLSDYSLDNPAAATAVSVAVAGTTTHSGVNKTTSGKPRSQRRPSNRDEFDGPHQYLKRPPPEYLALQDRELPRLPTNLLVQEQDMLLTRVNDRLSQCAYDFVAKYQFPIPLTQDMRPVERPQDREWTEWVYLLKRLATKRRIPARVLYNGQIKQFVTILENSLEMRHAAKHQSRPLKDDRNILQLISAGIQVAKILQDAQAMDYLDRLYVTTEQQIKERSESRFR